MDDIAFPVWAVFTVLSIAIGNFLCSIIAFGDDGDDLDCIVDDGDNSDDDDDDDGFIDTGICLRGVGNGNDIVDDGDFILYDLLWIICVNCSLLKMGFRKIK